MNPCASIDRPEILVTHPVEERIVTIHDLSRGGSGVARLDSGEIVFVPFTAPGDQLRIRIVERKKNYCQGVALEWLKTSASRATPECPAFMKCGGCSWQHLPYPLQFETKKKGLLHALGRAGIAVDSVPVDEMPAEHPYHYRNRIQLHGNADHASLGFFEPGTKKIVDITNCAIADPRINDMLPELRERGFRSFRGEFKLEIDLSEEGAVRSAWNRRHAAFGFRQVNDEQNKKLQEWVSANTGTADTLLDVYGGTGNLSLPIAERFKRVECIDLFTPKDPPASTPSHFHFIRQPIEKWIQSPLSPESANGSFSLVVDPPREGMGPNARILCEKLKKAQVSSLILVGCEVDSFIRDANQLIRRGYTLVRLGVLDLFPQTPHVESLALFSR
ncbi:MAG: TRAM domain-containing protein [Bdellovibrionales bacterium]|nr:TRAM domain-containing protein [Bdellovibrionales bacterium]